jgi:hypothetical protein
VAWAESDIKCERSDGKNNHDVPLPTSLHAATEILVCW